jgi:23S rRNA pseudouridine2605 synthase
MAFNKPGSGRGDQPGRSSNRPSKGDDNAKKSFSSSRGKSPSNSDRSGSAGKRRPAGESSGEKRSFGLSSKPYGERTNSGESKSSFSGGDKKSFAPKRPYSGRPADSDAPKRGYGSEASGDKKAFTPRNKPYSGRVTPDDRPPKSFGSGSSDEKKSFAPRNKSYSGRPSGDERPPKSFSKESSGERKFSGSASNPRERSSDRKFGDRPASGSGFKKRESGFGDRPATGGGFKKRESDFGDKPYRKPAGARDGSRPTSKPTYDKISVDRDAPIKTLRPKKASEAKDKGLIRLNRYIANAGICSRRKADELILAGVVSVNGEVVAELGAKVDPMKDEIKYNGETLRREKMIYVLLNKPKDYITTTEDPQERRTVMHLVEKASKERIYPIGRLDRNTTGLLLMTNDGDLADKLSHPKSNITKLYHVELSKSLAQGDLNKLQFGLELEDGPIKPDVVSYVAGGTKREIGVQIHSGKNRIVRRMFEHLGYEVVKLDRVVYANLTKKDLPRGRWRYLEEQEVIQLKHLIK